jgi:hypothetical protein
MHKEVAEAEGVALEAEDQTPGLVTTIPHLGVQAIEALDLESMQVIIQDRLAIKVFLDFPLSISAFHMVATLIIIRTDCFTPLMDFCII